MGRNRGVASWTRRVAGHHGIYGGTENTTTHSPSVDSVRHDEHLITYVESVPRDNIFVLMGDFNRVANLATGVWTTDKPPPTDVAALRKWQQEMHDRRIQGPTLRDEHTYQRLIKAGLADASTILHKPTGQS